MRVAETICSLTLRPSRLACVEGNTRTCGGRSLVQPIALCQKALYTTSVSHLWPVEYKTRAISTLGDRCVNSGADGFAGSTRH